MSKLIISTEANDLIQLAIDDCNNWEDWDRDDRSNFENMGTNLEKVQAHLTDEAKVLEEALTMLSICHAQISSQSDNEYAYDDETGNEVSVRSIEDFLVKHYHKEPEVPNAGN